MKVEWIDVPDDLMPDQYWIYMPFDGVFIGFWDGKCWSWLVGNNWHSSYSDKLNNGAKIAEFIYPIPPEE